MKCFPKELLDSLCCELEYSRCGRDCSCKANKCETVKRRELVGMQLSCNQMLRLLLRKGLAMFLSSYGAYK